MKTISSSNQNYGLLRGFAHATILAAIFLCAQNVCAAPRGPLPPFPESPPLYKQTFDVDYFLGLTNSELTVFGLGFLDESWSGYALQRTGEYLTPFIIPALDENGRVSIPSDASGALRWWVRPYWTSGAGYVAPATLLEMDAVSGRESAYAWSLQVGADGNTISLLTQTGAGVKEVLQTPISWLAGTSHSLVLDFSSQSTALFLDGALVAQGTGVASVPPSVGELILGSTLAGTNPAGADYDEFYSFGSWLSESDVSFYYRMNAPEAALGPISELSSRGSPLASPQMESIRTPGNVYDPNSAAPCSPGGPVYITNVTATLQPNGLTSMQFDIFGGENGILYDIMSTTNLADGPVDYSWSWAGQGLTCSSVLLTNQPPGQAYYVLEQPAETLTVAWGDNTYGESDVPAGLTNAVAVAAGGYFSLALRADGTVIGWGDDTTNQTNIPSGLSNVVSIAAGQYHGLALLSNGTVTNWGSYYDGTNYYAVTNYSIASRPPASNVVAVSAGLEHDLALMSNGTVVSWGLPWADANWVPANLTGVQAIGAGWYFNSALLTKGIVTNWGDSFSNFGWNLTTVPGDLTNAVAISANGYNAMALRPNGTVEVWGCPSEGFTNVPAGLSNIVAISEGGQYWQSLALQANGTLVAWGYSTNSSYNTAQVTGVKAISAGYHHNLIIESGPSLAIMGEPTNQVALVGGSVTFSAQLMALAGVQYQWEFDGVDLLGATNATLTLSDVQAANEGSYQVIVSTSGSITSLAATFNLVLPPQLENTRPNASGLFLFQPDDYSMRTQVANDYSPWNYLYGYQWQLNGTNIPGASGTEGLILLYGPTNDGTYTVVITNAAGSTNVTWNILLASPGMVEAWGDNAYQECNHPSTLTNAAAIAAGDYHSVAVTDIGTVTQWGQYWNGSNFYALVSPPAVSNFVSVAAGRQHDIGLRADGSLTNWGLGGNPANTVPANLPPVQAVASGWYHNVALLTNGGVAAWGTNAYGVTNVPVDLTNANAAIAIAARAWHSVAVRANGTVEAWGNTNGQTVPSGLTNVVAVAAGEYHCVALQSNGLVFAWGSNTFGQCNVPAGLSNVMAIAAGWSHSAALRNDGSIVEWGNNSSGQTNEPQPYPGDPAVDFKLIAAAGNHTLPAIWSPLVQYPVNVSKDLLLIYNSNSIDSSNVCQYYLTHRPMVANCRNVLGIGCTTNSVIWPADFTNLFLAQVQNWLSNNPTKRPLYVVLFQDLPQEVSPYTNSESANGDPSVQYQLHSWTAPVWYPFVTSINMNGTQNTNAFSSDGTNDCIAYINKLASIGNAYSPGKLIISANAGGTTNSYGNTNWYFDDSTPDSQLQYGFCFQGVSGVSNANPAALSTYVDVTNSNEGTLAGHITNGVNIAGFGSWGVHGYYGDTNAGYATNGTIQFTGRSGWYLIETGESFNGKRVTGQGNFLSWFAADAFGGTNYSNTPIGAVSNVEEPGTFGLNYPYSYFGDWAAGRSFACCAWQSFPNITHYLQVVGDPFVKQ